MLHTDSKQEFLFHCVGFESTFVPFLSQFPTAELKELKAKFKTFIGSSECQTYRTTKIWLFWWHPEAKWQKSTGLSWLLKGLMSSQAPASPLRGGQGCSAHKMTGYYVIELEWNSTRSLLPNHALCVFKFITAMYKDPTVGSDPECLKEVSWQEQAVCPWSKISFWRSSLSQPCLCACVGVLLHRRRLRRRVRGYQGSVELRWAGL